MYKSVEVQTHPQARPLPSRRWILASVAIATVAVIGLLGTMTIRDRDIGRSAAPSGSPAASAQTRDLTPAELNEMWAAADASTIGVELPAIVVYVSAPVTAEADAALWAIIDKATLTLGR